MDAFSRKNAPKLIAAAPSGARSRRATSPGQLSLEFRSPEQLAEERRWSREVEQYLNAPPALPKPALAPHPGWENVIAGKTRCKIMKSNVKSDIGKVVVVRRVNEDRRTVWVSDDEPAVYRKNTKGRWICQWDPMCVQQPFNLDDLRILPKPWVKPPPIYRSR